MLTEPRRKTSEDPVLRKSVGNTLTMIILNIETLTILILNIETLTMIILSINTLTMIISKYRNLGNDNIKHRNLDDDNIKHPNGHKLNNSLDLATSVICDILLFFSFCRFYCWCLRIYICMIRIIRII